MSGQREIFNLQNPLDDESSDSDEEDESLPKNHFKAVQMKNKEVVSSWIWQKNPIPQSRRTRRNLFRYLPGTKGPARFVTDCVKIWHCFISLSLIQKIVDCTNAYIDTIKENFSRPRDAKHTNESEIKTLIGLLYLAGNYHGNRLHLEELWTMDDFRCVMTFIRFRFLMRCIRLDDIGTREERKKTDRLAPIRDDFKEFVLNCQNCYSPGENVTIDEKLEGFRGRCSFRQYIPSKPNKYGIQIFVLVDAWTFYTYNMDIYAGQQPEGPFSISNKPVDVVKRLATPIHNMGRNTTTDNWFTDYNLVTYLSEKKLTLVGTLRRNKCQIPSEFKNTKDRKRFTSLFGFRKEATLVSYIPKPKKNVILITSVLDDGAIDEEIGEKKKPEIITFYNMTKGGGASTRYVKLTILQETQGGGRSSFSSQCSTSQVSMLRLSTVLTILGAT